MDPAFTKYLSTLKTKQDCLRALKTPITNSQEKRDAIEDIIERLDAEAIELAKNTPPEWIRAGVIGTVDFDKGRVGFVLRDKKGIATPIVEYVSGPWVDEADEEGHDRFTVCRILLHPATYANGILHITDETYSVTSRAGASASTIIAFCCGNLILRARACIDNVLPLTAEDYPNGDWDDDDVRAEWESNAGHRLECPPIHMTVAQARSRYATPLYACWHDWPPDRAICQVTYDGDAANPSFHLNDDPNERYEWEDREPGVYLYVIDDADGYRDVIEGPFETSEEACNWAWDEYHLHPNDVPR
jgi:hypothetical protein